MKSKNLIMMLALVVGIGLVVTACSGGGGGKSPTAPAAPSSGFSGASFTGDLATDDTDGDTTIDAEDNCPLLDDGNDQQPDSQLDSDGDGIGDLCDSTDDTAVGPGDDDNDGVNNDVDNCPAIANGANEDNQLDSDGDTIGDACDVDNDNDGVNNDVDNCEFVANGVNEDDQADVDGDGIGDACDPDNDNDGVDDTGDVCLGSEWTPFGESIGNPVSSDGCSVADLCPCADARNHGQHVSCVTQAAQDLRKDSVITNTQKADYTTEASQSVCGK